MSRAGVGVTVPHADADGHDQIVLRLPADGHFARVARVAVSAVAMRMGLDGAQVEDLRIAVDESLVLLLRRVSPPWLDDPGHRPGAPPDARPPAHTLHLVVWARPGDVLLELALVPPPPLAANDHEDERAARARFAQLTPPRVVATHADADAGVVTLALR